MDSRWRSLLATKADFILQSANCLTTKPRRVSKEIGDLYPHARVYNHRKAVFGIDLAIPKHRGVPGTAVICGSKISPGVITIFDEYRPGGLDTSEFCLYSALVIDVLENFTQRLTWFIDGLDMIGNELRKEYKNKPFVIAVPSEIGHQYWKNYKSVLLKFEHKYSDVLAIVIY